MILKNNPFFILNVSPNDNRRAIMSKAEELSLLGDSRQLEEAQSILINPGRRLSAELTWFINCDKDRMAQIIDAVNNNYLINTDGLESLPRLIALMHNLGVEEEPDYLTIGFYAVEIDELFSDIVPSEIVQCINSSRIIAGITETNETDVTDELSRLRDQIRVFISEKLSNINDEQYIDFATIIAFKYIAKKDYNSGVILDDIIDQYEIRMQLAIESSSDEIRQIIKRINDSPNNQINKLSNDLIIELKKWGDLIIPVLLKSEYNGTINDITNQTIRSVRELCIDFHNNKNQSKAAISILISMLTTFSFTNNIYDLFYGDANTLLEIVDNEEETQEILDSLEKLKKSFNSTMFNSDLAEKTCILIETSSLERNQKDDLLRVIVKMVWDVSNSNRIDSAFVVLTKMKMYDLSIYLMSKEFGTEISAGTKTQVRKSTAPSNRSSNSERVTYKTSTIVIGIIVALFLIGVLVFSINYILNLGSLTIISDIFSARHIISSNLLFNQPAILFLQNTCIM